MATVMGPPIAHSLGNRSTYHHRSTPVVLGVDQHERLSWVDPTGEQAIAGMPNWKWLRMVAMVEYLMATYGTEGVIRDDRGRVVGGIERPINHGTRGGYLAHLRRRIPPCRSCSEANTADFLRRRAERRAS